MVLPVQWDYYRQASCGQYLSAITAPTLLLHAKDDPFMLPNIIPDETQLSESTTLELSDHGGHLGFVSGTISHLVFGWPNAFQNFLKITCKPYWH